MINDYSSEGILITIQHMYAEGNPRPDVFDPGSRDDSTLDDARTEQGTFRRFPAGSGLVPANIPIPANASFTRAF